MRPLISVLFTTFNHRPYIQEAIESILTQTLSDFELIIMDDGSTDGTQEVIQKFQDPRIQYHFLNRKGVSGATNLALSKAQGKYIALMSGDDFSEPHRFSSQLKMLEAFDYDLLFCRPNLMDEEGKPLPDNYYESFYLPHTHNDAFYIRELFRGGNFFFAPSLFAKREVLLDLGPFQYASLQLQDFEYWIRAVKKYKVHILNERLMKYRLRAFGQNLSSEKNKLRIQLEKLFIYESFLSDLTHTQLRKNFPEQISAGSANDPNRLEVEIDFIYLAHWEFATQTIGLKRLFYHFQNEATRKILIEDMGFTENKYFGLLESLAANSSEKLYFLKMKVDDRLFLEEPCIP